MTNLDNHNDEQFNDSYQKTQIRNAKRLSTLKLWQMHLQSLTKPENTSLANRYNDNYEHTEMHTVSESTIISSNRHHTVVNYLDDDHSLLFDITVPSNDA